MLYRMVLCFKSIVSCFGVVRCQEKRDIKYYKYYSYWSQDQGKNLPHKLQQGQVLLSFGIVSEEGK